MSTRSKSLRVSVGGWEPCESVFLTKGIDGSSLVVWFKARVDDFLFEVYCSGVYASNCEWDPLATRGYQTDLLAPGLLRNPLQAQGHLSHLLDPFLLQHPLHGCSQVIVVGLQPLEPDELLDTRSAFWPQGQEATRCHRGQSEQAGDEFHSVFLSVSRWAPSLAPVSLTPRRLA
jgi:hypothetical protein